MVSAATIQYSFSGGELAPALRNRVDWQKRAGGAKKILNGIVQPTGGVFKRPGNRFVNKALHDDKPITLVAFEFSSDQTYMIEFGDYVMRVYWGGAPIADAGGADYTIATPYSAEQAKQFRFAQDRDAMFFAHIDVAPQRLTRYGHTDWRWAPMFIDVTRIQSPAGLQFISPLDNGHNNFEYVVTAYKTVSGNRQESIGYNVLRSLASDADRITQAPQKNIASCIRWIDTYSSKYGNMSGFPSYPEIMKRIVNLMSDCYLYGTIIIVRDDIIKVMRLRDQDRLGLPADANLVHVSEHDGGYEWRVWRGDQYTIAGYYYVQFPTQVNEWVTWYLRDMCIAWFNQGNNIVDGYTLNGIYNSITSFISTFNEENGIKDYNHFKWNGVSDAQGYYVYRRAVNSDDPNFRLIADITATDFRDPIGETIPGTRTPIAGTTSFSDPLDYPAVVALFEQRLMYGRTKKNPSSIYASHVGLYTDFSINPSDDASGYEFRLSSQKLNAIMDILSLGRLFILTSGAEFVADGGSGAMTAKNVNMVQQSQYGTSNIPAIIINNAVVHIPRDRSMIDRLQYQLNDDGFVGSNLLYFAGHLTAGKNIIDIAFQRQPKNVIWVVLDDGSLLSCTYIPEQDFLAWTRHKTQGEVTSIATIANDKGQDELWSVARRTLADGTVHQYIERLEDQLAYDETAIKVENSFYVDSGLSLNSFDPVTNIAGLDHLEGLEVAILADGNVLPRQTVVNGRITLDVPARVVHAGLPYDFLVETLDLETPDGTLRHVKRQPWKAWVELYMTRQLRFRANKNRWHEVLVQDGMMLGEVPATDTGFRELVFQADTTNEIAFTFESSDPVPCGILSLMAMVQYGNS